MTPDSDASSDLQHRTAVDCYTCQQNDTSNLPKRDRIVLNTRWRVAHAFNTSLPGWLVAVPRRHITTLTELTPDEAADLGPLLVDLSAALTEVVGCSKTYVALFAEAAGFNHVHFHVVPRMPDQEDDFRGPGVFALLGRSDTDRVTDRDMDDLAERLVGAADSIPGRCRASGEH